MEGSKFRGKKNLGDITWGGGSCATREKEGGEGGRFLLRTNRGINSGRGKSRGFWGGLSKTPALGGGSTNKGTRHEVTYVKGGNGNRGLQEIQEEPKEKGSCHANGRSGRVSPEEKKSRGQGPRGRKKKTK